jgi:TPP-dependent indolepyruvate ferredoxin oxidoreductase alpha subunit
MVNIITPQGSDCRTDTLSGEEVLAATIRSCSDTVYAVPGYPVTGLISRVGARLVINEKVALELALGDSLAGKRSCVVVKHVGMNALLDPLVHATFQGLIGGVIIVCGDDPIAKGTMTIQDSRFFGPIAGIPVLEGIRPGVVGDAFLASEQFSRVSLIRVTPTDLEGRHSMLHIVCEENTQSKKQGKLADPDLTMFGRAHLAYSATEKITDAGFAPLPLPSLPSFPCSDASISRITRGYTLSLCAECQFRGLYTLMQMKGMSVICDTGCSLMAMNPPFSSGVASYGMGSAVAVAARSTHVALIGDYALIHSGLQGLIEVYHQNLPLLCIVMVNRCMGMTGGQQTPDPTPYLGFAHPVSCDAADLSSLDRLLTIPDRPVTLLVHGRCPEVIIHETVAC